MGYLPEKGALRILYGIPGAGSVSAPQLTDRTLSLLEVSPDQMRALAIAAGAMEGDAHEVATGVGVRELDADPVCEELALGFRARCGTREVGDCDGCFAVDGGLLGWCFPDQASCWDAQFKPGGL